MYEKNYNLWMWGFTSGAENWNGRLAMIGFLATVFTEIIVKQNILAFLGLV